MANTAHRSVLLDHQMIVYGVLMQEKKNLTKTLNDETGVEESHLSPALMKKTLIGKTGRNY